MMGMIGVMAMGQQMFEKIYKGINNYVNSTSVQQTSDGGYIMGAWTDYSQDAYIIKTDSNGGINWTTGFNDGQGWILECVQQTSDGGYIGVGNISTHDLFIVRLNSNGAVLWAKYIDNGYYDQLQAYSIRQTYDGGFIVLATDDISHLYMSAMLIIKLDSLGNIIWSTAGGFNNGYYYDDNINVYSIEQTLDSGYILSGYSYTYSYFLIKFDSNGSYLWSNGYVGNGFMCVFNDAIPTNDGGIAAVGYAENNNPSVNLTKTDGNGNVIFSKTYGLSVIGYAYNVKQTADNGFIIGAYQSFGGNDNFYIVKTDSLGNLIWAKGYGGSLYDDPNTVLQTTDGGYAILGNSSSFTPDSSNVIYLVKTDANGNSGGCYESNPSNFDSTIIISATSLPFMNGMGLSNYTYANVNNLIFESGGHDSLLCAACDTPTVPGPISGNTLVCYGSVQTYTIYSVPNATSYIWTLPTGWTGSSTSTSITVTVDTPSANISVVSQNSCSISTTTRTLAVSVVIAPNQPDPITGDTVFCAGTSTAYSIAPVAGATSYTWTLPSGWTGSSSTNSITITSNSTSGYITVTADNLCGSSPPESLYVTVNPLPVVTAAPTDTMVCVNTSPYTLMFGNPLNGIYSGTGVSNGIFDPSTTGLGTFPVTYTYTDSLGCSDSAIQNITVDICLNINSLNSLNGINLFPNPAFNTITFYISGAKNYELMIADVLGNEIYHQPIINQQSTIINIVDWSNGVYFYQLTNSKETFRGKFVKE